MPWWLRWWGGGARRLICSIFQLVRLSLQDVVTNHPMHYWLATYCELLGLILDNVHLIGQFKITMAHRALRKWNSTRCHWPRRVSVRPGVYPDWWLFARYLISTWDMVHLLTSLQRLLLPWAQCNHWFRRRWSIHRLLWAHLEPLWECFVSLWKNGHHHATSSSPIKG